jgi:hypothetical protein
MPARIGLLSRVRSPAYPYLKVSAATFAKFVAHSGECAAWPVVLGVKTFHGSPNQKIYAEPRE